MINRSFRFLAMPRKCLSILLFVALVAATRNALPADSAAADAAAADKPVSEGTPAPAPVTDGPKPLKWYRLESVDIPTDSPLRAGGNYSKPPWMYVIVRRNGVNLGGTSSSKLRGWSVEFPIDKTDNVWPIATEGDDRFSLELWSNETVWDQQILTITHLTAGGFAEEILERAGKNMPKDRLAVVRFVELPPNEDGSSPNPERADINGRIPSRSKAKNSPAPEAKP